ncbi:hypothetical protein GUITHDRAFT_111131 [Guillardia theta CCMP2712]|uniref:Uncharacterized protein n=1 Tax=Guillardia theta (strain CCMP2712) TaxID=905079 RepID=L1J393_GUITC|nr:hypothetical protein GUITHDRAFT_111131 [Guillardia theta CCMP2712]EKX42762.1 hypothetical protein GUITHDRAFT_111131 [Guillardia theta CCMP2712]|eukprot:XP_005829742.1 hypothetical protein GUITHDRAFT_111131 [Guillardia theta CCMP2712]
MLEGSKESGEELLEDEGLHDWRSFSDSQGFDILRVDSSAHGEEVEEVEEWKQQQQHHHHHHHHQQQQEQEASAVVRRPQERPRKHLRQVRMQQVSLSPRGVQHIRRGNVHARGRGRLGTKAGQRSARTAGLEEVERRFGADDRRCSRREVEIVDLLGSCLSSCLTPAGPAALPTIRLGVILSSKSTSLHKMGKGTPRMEARQSDRNVPPLDWVRSSCLNAIYEFEREGGGGLRSGRYVTKQVEEQMRAITRRKTPPPGVKDKVEVEGTEEETMTLKQRLSAMTGVPWELMKMKNTSSSKAGREGRQFSSENL